MCGRYVFYKANPELRHLARKEFDHHGRTMRLPEFASADRWNIAPTQRAAVVRAMRVAGNGAGDGAGDGDGLRCDELRWGLIPGWAKDASIGSKAINARVETAPVKPMFRSAWKSRRCLVPASGFYEWSRTTPKRPWYFHAPDQSYLMLAGLWESWVDTSTGEVLDTFTILTREPFDVVRPVHDRSPVILPPSAWGPWLYGELKAPDEIASIPADLAAHPVSTAVNSSRAEGPRLIDPAA